MDAAARKQKTGDMRMSRKHLFSLALVSPAVATPLGLQPAAHTSCTAAKLRPGYGLRDTSICAPQVRIDTPISVPGTSLLGILNSRTWHMCAGHFRQLFPSYAHQALEQQAAASSPALEAPFSLSGLGPARSLRSLPGSAPVCMCMHVHT